MTTTTSWPAPTATTPTAATASPDTPAAAVTLAAAVQHLADVRARVLAGDTTVTPTDLSEAEHAVEFARLREQAACQAEGEDQVEQRAARYIALGEQARAPLAPSDEQIAEAFTTAQVALESLWWLAEQRSTRLRELAHRTAAVMDEADRYRERPLIRDAGIHNRTAGITTPASVTLGPPHGPMRTITDVPGRRIVAALLVRVLQMSGDAVPEGPLEAELTAAARVYPSLFEDVAGGMPGR